MHLPLQACCVAVLLAADAVGWALWGTAARLVLTKAASQVLLGGVLPSLLLLHMEQATALARQRRLLAMPLKKVD